jgi:putative phage-type endonuclease
MNLVKELQQRSPEWHKIRKGSIGGTRVKTAFAKNNLPLVDELIAERHSDTIEESYVNDAMQRGIDLEPVAIAEFEERTELKVDTFGLATNDKFNGCHLSPDGLILDDYNVAVSGIEVKCPSTKKHVEYIRTNKVPAEYKFQVYHYFAICETVEIMYFVSFDPRFEIKPLHIVTLHRDDIQKELEEYESGLIKFIDKLKKYESEIVDTF